MRLQIQSTRLALFACGATSFASLANAQATFSVDWHSPTVGTPNTCTGMPITEGDILVPFGGAPALGPLPTPCISISAGAGGLGLAGWGTCVGHPGGTPCIVEVDALSYGTDFKIPVVLGMSPASFYFSTDEYAVGGVPPVNFTSIALEAPCGDSSTDVWRQGSPMPTGPLAPFAAPVGHKGVIDGDGIPVACTGAAYPGTGLLEPNFPGFPNIGDNLDAFDFNQGTSTATFPATGVYFSLDDFLFDPLVGMPNSGSAPAHGFAGADVLWSGAPGGPPVLFAPAALLGLNITGALDDLDALAIWENGSGAFEPSLLPLDWVGGSTDMLLFSVRRGSSVIGMPDSIFGIPISEGDILTTPLSTAFGGVSPFPGIFCAGENIGLSVRVPGFDDDLNALDVLNNQFADCNGNGVDDSIDIANGTSTDINGNGIPDECEIIGGPACFCPAPLGPCGNNYAPGGCMNSTGVGGLLAASGSGSVTLDNLVLTATQLAPTNFGIMFGGTTFMAPLPFGDGLRCAGGFLVRFTAPTLTTPTGTLTAGPGLATAFGLLPFSTWTFQAWFRDPTGPCLSGFNTTHSQDVTFTP